MIVYDGPHWVDHFRISKETMFEICNKLQPYIEQQDTRYRVAVLVEIRVCMTLYKLAHGANFLSCSELFTIGQATEGRSIWEVVRSINIAFKDMISWPWGDEMLTMMAGFQEWCHMPGIQGP